MELLLLDFDRSAKAVSEKETRNEGFQQEHIVIACCSIARRA